MKKILSMVLAILLAVSVLPGGIYLTASAATSGTTGDCTWTLNGTTLTISGNGKMGNYDYFDTLPWGEYITKVIIENGVTNIGSWAFSGYSGLTIITIPNSVKSIGDSAFYDCSNLTGVTIGDSVTSIGDYAFEDCSSLKSITIPTSVTSIGECAFSGCSSLTSITIPEGITSISEATFSYCSSLTSITIPDSVTRICEDAFYGCDSLSEVVGNKGNITFEDGNDIIKELEWLDHIHDYNNEYICNICSFEKKVSSFFNISLNSEKQPIVFYKNKLLLEGQDYKISQNENNYTIVGIHDYRGISSSFKNPIKKDISKATVSVSSCNYTGHPQTPSVEVSVDDEFLEENKDFTLHYYDNTQQGTAKVIVVGKGDYTGYVEEEFTIGEFVPIKDTVKINDECICEITINGKTTTYSAPGLSYPTIDLSEFPNGNISISYYTRGYESKVMMVKDPSGGYSYQYVHSWVGSSTYHFVSAYNDTKRTPYDLVKNSNLVSDVPTVIDAKTLLFKVSAENTNACLDDIVWSSSNANVGTIDGGVFKIKNSGKTKITATVNGKTAEWDFEVEPLDIAQKGEVVCYDPSTQKVDVVYDGILLVDGEDFITTTENIGNTTIVTCTGINIFKGTLSQIYYANSSAPFCSNEILLSSLPNVTEYYCNHEVLDLTGAKVSVDLGNGVKTTIDITNKMVSGFDNSVIGTQKITISCCGQTTEFNVNITDVCSHRSTRYIDAKEPTCLVQGNYAHTICNICKQVITGSSQKIPFADCVYTNSCDTSCNVCEQPRIAPHNYEWVIDKQGNCIEYGERHEECTICHTKRNENTIIPALGNHTLVVIPAVNPTCTEFGYTEGVVCSVCDAILTPQLPLPGTGHNIIKVQTLRPTCKAKGVKTCVCTKCGYSYTEDIPSLGHTEEIIPAVEPTYTATGLTAGKMCSVCGTVTVKQNIIPALPRTSLKTAKFTVKDATYTGKAITQKITVKLGSKTLKAGVDYTISYKNNKNVGKATIAITGIGAYKDSIVKIFKINPKSTKISKVTAGKKSLKVTVGKQTKEVTGYEIQYSTLKKFKSAKTVTIKKAKTTSATIKKLKAKKTYYVRVRTYKTVGGKKYYSTWSTYKKAKTK